MAQVLAKIFQNRKYQCNNQSKNSSKSSTRWHVPPSFAKENISLVIFKDRSGSKQTVLDSRCWKKVTIQDLLCEKCRKCYKGSSSRCLRACCKVCPGIYANSKNLPTYRNIHTASKNDVQLICEMVFGTLPLANSGTTLKVHSLRNPNQIMLSIVFPFAKKCQDNSYSNDFDELGLDSFESSVYGLAKRNSENNLTSMGSTGSISKPVDVPPNSFGSDNSINLSASYGSLYTPANSPTASSTSSIVSSSKLCMMRRLRRSWNRSLEYNTKVLRGCGGKSPFESENSSMLEGESAPTRKRETRLGIAILFNLDEFDDLRQEFENFFFSHITLIEGHLAQLRSVVEKGACLGRESAYTSIMEELEVFKQNIYDLYTAPRLQNPVWLSLMAGSTQRLAICDKFVREFTILIDRYDTKQTDNFVSTLLTGVLMYHLAWVPTVTPSGEAHSSYADKHSPRWLDMLAKSHPYNPLWAQLSDIYGAIGIPPRLARTVVTGTKVDTVVRFLYVLSYFIRCSEIHEQFDECYDEDFLLSQLESAADEICLTSMENEANMEFVLVDTPVCLDSTTNSTADSGLVSQYTGQTTTTKQRDSVTRLEDGESGYQEPFGQHRTNLADVQNFPLSSPAEKVREWINTSQLAPHSKSPITEPLIHKSATASTLINSEPTLSPSTHCVTARTIVELARSPVESRTESVRALGRTAHEQLFEISESSKELSKSGSGDLDTPKASLRTNLVRLFSSEAGLDEFNEYFDGRPPTIQRQISNQSNSIFDEYFEDPSFDGLSSEVAEPCSENVIEATTPTNPQSTRNVLFKVLKETGFHNFNSNNGVSPSTCCKTHDDLSEGACLKQPASRVNSSQHVASEDKPRRLSLSKQSSRCSSPQTIRNGDNALSPTEDRCRHASACQTIFSDPNDVFDSYTEVPMPRSKVVSALADTSISTTSFGRQQFASYSERYLSDFVLHGTSDNDILPKIKKDLESSVEHSVLEDRISEAVCIVADTERWKVDICSSMREQPKKLHPSHLVISMVETISNMSKLKMSSEFILLHMEDRLQEMFFKSRMLAGYIQSRKKVDMDELGAMFGLEANDIRFLLSVASTHSTVNLQGIY